MFKNIGERRINWWKQDFAEARTVNDNMLRNWNKQMKSDCSDVPWFQRLKYLDELRENSPCGLLHIFLHCQTHQWHEQYPLVQQHYSTWKEIYVSHQHHVCQQLEFQSLRWDDFNPLSQMVRTDDELEVLTTGRYLAKNKTMQKSGWD